MSLQWRNQSKDGYVLSQVGAIPIPINDNRDEAATQSNKEMGGSIKLGIAKRNPSLGMVATAWAKTKFAHPMSSFESKVLYPSWNTLWR